MAYADLPGVRLYYEDAGRGTPLLLVHGIGTTHEDWESQIPVFARRFRVIAPDLRGYGRSDKAGDYRVGSFAADLWALLDHLGVQRFHLVGHSMGGAIALQMAVDRPERVTRLVAADTLPSFIANTFNKRVLFAYRYTMMSVFGPQRLAQAVANKLFPAPHLEKVRERFRLRAQANDRNVYLKNLRQLVGWSVADRLQRLTMPVLVLAAEHDYFPYADAGAFAASLPDARFKLFAGMHHALPLEAPRRFNAVVLRFLAGAPRLRQMRGPAAERRRRNRAKGASA